MKKFMMFALVGGMLAFAACGGGNKEQAKKDSLMKDSIKKDSIAKVEAAAKAEADKKAAEEKAKMVAEMTTAYNDSVTKKMITLDKDMKNIVTRKGKKLATPVALPEGVVITPATPAKK